MELEISNINLPECVVDNLCTSGIELPSCTTGNCGEEVEYCGCGKNSCNSCTVVPSKKMTQKLLAGKHIKLYEVTGGCDDRIYKIEGERPNIMSCENTITVKKGRVVSGNFIEDNVNFDTFCIDTTCCNNDKLVAVRPGDAPGYLKDQIISCNVDTLTVQEKQLPSGDWVLEICNKVVNTDELVAVEEGCEAKYIKDALNFGECFETSISNCKLNVDLKDCCFRKPRAKYYLDRKNTFFMGPLGRAGEAYSSDGSNIPNAPVWTGSSADVTITHGYFTVGGMTFDGCTDILHGEENLFTENPGMLGNYFTVPYDGKYRITMGWNLDVYSGVDSVVLCAFTDEPGKKMILKKDLGNNAGTSIQCDFYGLQSSPGTLDPIWVTRKDQWIKSDTLLPRFPPYQRPCQSDGVVELKAGTKVYFGGRINTSVRGQDIGSGEDGYIQFIHDAIVPTSFSNTTPATSGESNGTATYIEIERVGTANNCSDSRRPGTCSEGSFIDPCEGC